MRPDHAPHKWSNPAYGQKMQFAKDADTSSFLDQKGKRWIQSIVGSCPYYGQAIDGKILTALNAIGPQQAKATINTKINASWLLDYLHTHPDT